MLILHDLYADCKTYGELGNGCGSRVEGKPQV